MAGLKGKGEGLKSSKQTAGKGGRGSILREMEKNYFFRHCQRKVRRTFHKKEERAWVFSAGNARKKDEKPTK